MVQARVFNNRKDDEALVRPIRFTLRKHQAYVDQAYLDLIRPVLERTVRRFTDSGSGGTSSTGETVAYYKILRKRGRIVFPAGLVPRVAGHLEGLGHSVEVQDQSWWPQLRRANTPLFLDAVWLRNYESEYLDALLAHPRGQVVFSKTSEFPRLIGLACRLFPAENVQVIAKNNAEARHLRDKIGEVTGREVLAHTASALSCRQRLCVGTWDDVIDCNFEHWAVTIFADVESATAAGSVRTATRHDPLLLRHSLLYAFVPANRPLDSETQFRLEAVVGQEIFNPDEEPSCFTKVKVIGVGPSSYPSARDLTPLERKRAFIWHNRQRNQAIADIAQAFATADRQALRRLGIWSSEVERLLDNTAVVFTVAILVEVLEHGRALRKLLPKWKLLGAADGSTRVSNQELPALADEKTNGAIITMVRAHRARVAADVIIRADATASSWGDDYMPNCCFNGNMMLVIDMGDDSDEQATLDTQSRWREYTERGWEISGHEEGIGARASRA